MATLSEMTRMAYMAYKTDTALRRHAISAHGGEVREDCPACVEIQERMEIIRNVESASAVS